MITKIKLTAIICCLSFFVQAQTISMEFPAFASKTYDFIIFQGSKGEKVLQGTIPPNGQFELTIPNQYAPYTGMCRWLLTNSEFGGGLDMAIPGHDFSISCQSDKPDNTNIIYTGFDAVNELNRLNGMQQKIIDKFETMSKAMQLYDKKHKLYKKFAKEKKAQEKAYQDFHNNLKNNTNYNARFLPIVTLIHGYAHRLSYDDYEKGVIFNEFITQKINIDDLYVSGHWDGIIQSWVVFQVNVVNDKVQFAQDFKLLHEKIKKPSQYTDFVGKMTYYLTQYGKDDYIEAIAPLVLGSGKINSYEGKTMQVYVTAMIGSQAPDLIIKNSNDTTIIKTSALNSKQTLLLFYKSGCGPCETTIEALKTNYSKLTAQGLRVIAISGDTDANEFKTTAATFPWQDTFCDLEGTNGVNFKNYAVIGTPTMYLLDKDGKIEKKLATVEELEAH